MYLLDLDHSVNKKDENRLWTNLQRFVSQLAEANNLSIYSKAAVVGRCDVE